MSLMYVYKSYVYSTDVLFKFLNFIILENYTNYIFVNLRVTYFLIFWLKIQLKNNGFYIIIVIKIVSVF